MNQRWKVAIVVLATVLPLTLIGLQRFESPDRITTAGAATDSARLSGSADMPPEPNAPPSPQRIADESGDPAHVQSVKDALPGLVLGYCVTGTADYGETTPPDAKVAAIAAASSIAEQRVAAVWATNLVASNLERVGGYLATLRQSSDWPVVRACRLDNPKVVGVETDGKTAKASLLGELNRKIAKNSHTFPSATDAEGYWLFPATLFNVELVNEADGWRLTAYLETGADGGQG